MKLITILTGDPLMEKLLEYMTAELPEPEQPLVLLDAAQLERIRDFPEAKVIVFSASADPGYLKPAYLAGAAGFWYVEPDVQSLSRVLAGQPAFPETAPEAQLGKVKSSGLAQRELEVLREIAWGKTDAQAGEKLGISVPTVKHHIQQLLLKTGAANRTQLAAEAVRCGLIQKP